MITNIKNENVKPETELQNKLISTLLKEIQNFV